MIVNWPQAIFRNRDKGVSGLSAEDADKLHDTLFVVEQRIQFVPCGEGKFLVWMVLLLEGHLTLPPESACNNNRITSLAVGSDSDLPRESDPLTGGKQARFRVTTAEAYPHKKRRV